MSKADIFNSRGTSNVSLRRHIIHPRYYGATLWITGGLTQAAHVEFVEIKCLPSKSLPKMVLSSRSKASTVCLFLSEAFFQRSRGNSYSFILFLVFL